MEAGTMTSVAPHGASTACSAAARRQAPQSEGLRASPAAGVAVRLPRPRPPAPLAPPAPSSSSPLEARAVLARLALRLGAPLLPQPLPPRPLLAARLLVRRRLPQSLSLPPSDGAQSSSSEPAPPSLPLPPQSLSSLPPLPRRRRLPAAAAAARLVPASPRPRFDTTAVRPVCRRGTRGFAAAPPACLACRRRARCCWMCC
jgi:hypothetical protein